MFNNFARRFSRRFTRLLDNREQFELPAEGWDNQKNDARKYRVSFSRSWQVSEEQFKQAQDGGVICQELVKIKGNWVSLNVAKDFGYHNLDDRPRRYIVTNG